MDDDAFVLQLEGLRVLPVVAVDASTRAADLARTLTSAGLTGVQLTPCSGETLELLAALAEIAPGLVLGADAVRSPGQVQAAVAAGAHFVSAPTVDPDVIRRAQEVGAAVVPVVTGYPEAIAAARESVRVVRLDFPLPAHGHEGVRRYARLFPRLRFLPAGAIGPRDIGGYLRTPAVAAVATSWLDGQAPADVSRGASELAHAAAAAL